MKACFGTSKSTVRSEIWIAVSDYVLVAVIKKRLHLFEKTPLDIALSRIPDTPEPAQTGKQLILPLKRWTGRFRTVLRR